MTSFDWNEQDPNVIGTCSIDTTCTIWDISKMQESRTIIKCEIPVLRSFVLHVMLCSLATHHDIDLGVGEDAAHSP